MKESLVIIDGHPDSDRHHLCHALAEACQEGARSGGNTAEIIRVADLDFPLLRSEKDFNSAEVPPVISEAQQTVAGATHLVFIYPLWMGDMPALLKGFIEQLFRPGFAMEEQSHGLPRKLLKGKRATVIVTMGMPAAVYRLFFFSHTLKSFKRNVLQLCGVGPVLDVLIGGVSDLSDEQARDWLGRIAAIGAGRRHGG